MEFLNNGDIRHARYSKDQTIERNVKLSLFSKHILIILSLTLHSIRLVNEIILSLTKLIRLSEKKSLLTKLNPSLTTTYFFVSVCPSTLLGYHLFLSSQNLNSPTKDVAPSRPFLSHARLTR